MSVHTYLWQSAADRRLCSYLLRVAQVKAVGLAEVVFTQNIDTSGQRVQTREIFYCSKQESAFFKTKNQSVMSFSPFLKALRETLQRVYFE